MIKKLNMEVKTGMHRQLPQLASQLASFGLGPSCLVNLRMNT